MRKIILLSVVFILSLLKVCARSMSDFQPAKHAGTRFDPIPALDGYADTKLGNFYEDKAIVRIGVSGVLRGNDVLQVVDPLSLMFEKTEPKNEVAIVYVYVSNIKDLTGKDEPISISSSSFKVVDSRYSQKPNTTFIIMQELLDTEIYEGGEAEGWIPCEAPKGEPFYLLLGDKWFVLDANSNPFEQL